MAAAVLHLVPAAANEISEELDTLEQAGTP